MLSKSVSIRSDTINALPYSQIYDMTDYPKVLLLDNHQAMNKLLCVFQFKSSRLILSKSNCNEIKESFKVRNSFLVCNERESY